MEGYVSYDQLVRLLKRIQEALEEDGDVDAALRFEVMAEYVNDTPASRPLRYEPRMIGL